MYKEFETRTSYNYLKEVIQSLNEPICILGGWAVFFYINKAFEQAQGRPYLGSRDIDLGFHISRDLTKSTLSQSIEILTKKLNSKPLSFRLVKEIHAETEEEIKEGQYVPIFFTFPMYVDLIVDSIPSNFKKVFGFNPMDEPLLKIVFERKEYIITKEFGKNLLLPKTALLMAMKVKSIPGRGKEHKKIKDICDLFALGWYTDINPEKIDLTEYVAQRILDKCFDSITDDDLNNTVAQVGHQKEELRRIFSLICKRK